MIDLIIWPLLVIILIEGAYIWTLRDQREQLKGGMNRLNRENADLARSLKVTRSRMK